MVKMNLFARKSLRSILPAFAILIFGISSFSGVAFAASTSSTTSSSRLLAFPPGSPFQVLPNPGPGPLYYHWYAGGVYDGSSGTATQVNSNVTIPGPPPPKSDQFYYVILSIWDNTGSYDQIGFTDDNGIWGLAYSYTTGFNGTTCSGTITYHYSPDAKTLKAGTTYDFFITIKSGTVYFDTYSAGKHIFDLSTNNGAKYFSVSGAFCGYYDYTVYEEAYMNTATAVPNHNFNFAHNYYEPGQVLPSWMGFTISAPSKVKVVVSGPDDSRAKIVN